MTFWRHYKALCVKNFYLYKRNWKGSLCEILLPLFMILMLLALRFAISKETKGPDSLLDSGYLWYDQGSTTANKEFADYSIFPNDTTWFNYCFDRDDTPDRNYIALAPSGNTIINNIKARLEADFGSTYNLTVKLYASRDEIINTIKSSTYEKDDIPGICFGAAFTEATADKVTVNMIFDDMVSDRNDDPNMPNQDLPPADDFQRGPNEDAFGQYKTGGYTYLQNIIANEILMNTRGAGAYISMLYTGMKTNVYNKDDFPEQVADLWPMAMMLLFLAPMYRLLFNCTQEKGTKMREAMKVMGLTDLPYWCSWLTYYTLINTILCLGMMLLLIPVTEYSNKFLIFLYFWLYGMSLFGYCVLIMAFFSSPKTAGLVGTMLFFALSFVNQLVNDRTVSATTKNLASIFPSLAVQLASTNLLAYEEAGIGILFGNANESYQNYKFATSLWMNTLSFFIFTILGIYLENVLPSTAGVRKPLWFPFTKSFWFDTKKNTPAEEEEASVSPRKTSNKVRDSSDLEAGSEECLEISADNFEEVPENLRRKEDDQEFVKISNLKKKFEKFWAVDGLNSEMYEDQIFALLGHNGAGKTTTINMLCGMIAPTSGKASIYGYDITQDMKSLRKIMGYCPQHNILFPKLTVAEHLRIFSEFKGKPRSEITEEIEEILEDLNMIDKRDVLSMNLSGGYKRKLSLGIALVGGSKIVFLDEPSSGMDVTARREMWDMLKKYKNNRIIILTTHYMEEADNLGDRIGIMSQGKMLCCGRPEFLKNRFGEGFNLVIVKEERKDNHKLEEFILNSIEGSKKVSEVSSEATYLLPKDSTNKFPEFFKEFDSKLGHLKVNSYGVSTTTLEEVFLKVENSGKEEDEKVIEKIKKRMTSEYNPDSEYSMAKEQIEGPIQIFFLHLWALLIKRFLLSKRNIKGLVIEIFVPFILILAGYWMATVQFYKDSAQRNLDPSLFPLDQRVIYNTYTTGGHNSADLISLLDPSSNFTTAEITTSGSSERAHLQNFDEQIYNASLLQPFSPYRYGHYFFNSLDYTNHRYEVATLFNTTSQDAAVAFPHFIYEAILKKSISSTFNYTMINDPMPIVQVYKDQEKGGNSLFLGLVLSIGLAMIPTSVIGFLIHERSRNLVHQQTISGMSKFSYWISNYFFDIIKVFIPVIFAIIFMYILNVDYPYAWLLLLLYPFAIVPYTYVTSFIFTEEGPAQNFTILHHFFISGFCPIVIFVLRLIRSTSDFGDVIMWFPRFLPSYNTVGGIIVIAMKDLLANDRKEKAPGPLSFDAAGGDLILLIFHAFFWPIMLILIEKGFFDFLRKKGKSIEEEEEILDNDVLKERNRVEETSESELAVKVSHLRKVYGNNVAVKDVSFGLEFGDCFCLLGVNGAGKTSTFKMLTGDIVPTKGDSYICGNNVNSNFSEVRKQIGYCPQFDCIFDMMTVREHLEFYTKIKKIPKEYTSKLISEQLKSMNLEQYENKLAGTLSGGNKRKLSVAMAMIGNPPVVFLDEPSAGMDPKARRFMWEVIAKISTRGKNSAVILTTHSMEEAEALSTSMGIMVGGQFKCFGSKQHIKNKFGTGYQVEVKFKGLNTKDVENKIESIELVQFLRDKYPASCKIENIKNNEEIMLNEEACRAVLKECLISPQTLDEFNDEGFGYEICKALKERGFYSASELIKWEHITRNNLETVKTLVSEFGEVQLVEKTYLRYSVEKKDKSIGYFFGLLENLRNKLDLDEYSVSQTTLEQIFNGFARSKDHEIAQRIFTKPEMEDSGGEYQSSSSSDRILKNSESRNRLKNLVQKSATSDLADEEE
ncbi:unnamed protein product [Moneuplotes crassus]|uniref:ABC transporter domain-containing protein n=1 Tax=Euplotes crassus TaxID=5936 RepID=A0AAD2DAB7_EUPCR|nr:unnamed protein product [Moneuplotes crassus]